MSEKEAKRSKPTDAEGAMASAAAAAAAVVSSLSSSVNGVAKFGWDRFAKSTKNMRWAAATATESLLFCMLMCILTSPPVRALISAEKIGFHRTAADGETSFEVALFICAEVLVSILRNELGDEGPTANDLYLFMHHYIDNHLTQAEFEEFFGEGSCAYGGAYLKAIMDALMSGMCKAASVEQTCVNFILFYISFLCTLNSLHSLWLCF